MSARDCQSRPANGSSSSNTEGLHSSSPQSACYSCRALDSLISNDHQAARQAVHQPETIRRGQFNAEAAACRPAHEGHGQRASALVAVAELAQRGVQGDVAQAQRWQHHAGPRGQLLQRQHVLWPCKRQLLRSNTALVCCVRTDVLPKILTGTCLDLAACPAEPTPLNYLTKWELKVPDATAATSIRLTQQIFTESLGRRQ